MKYLTSYSYIKAFICLIFLLYPQMNYANCKNYVSKDIVSQSTAEGLSQTIYKLNKNKELTKECYYYIGKQYIYLYKKSLGKQYLLAEAIKHLTFALNTISEIASVYKDCQYYYNEAKMYQDKSYAISQLNDYIADPFSQPSYVHNSEVLESDFYQLDKINTYLKIKELKTAYENELKRFDINNYTRKQLEKLAEIIGQLESEGIKENDSKLQAFKHLNQYHALFEKSQRSTENEECNLLKMALSSLKTAKQTLYYVKDSLNMECHTGFVCLSREIQIEFDQLMPDHKNRDDFNKRLNKCQHYLDQYKNLLSQCNNEKVTEDKRPILNNLIAFYQAYNSFTDPRQNSQPTLCLEKFLHEIQKDFNDNARRLYQLAAFYIATYYFEKSLDLLTKGPGKNREQTLREIFNLNTKLHPHRNFIKMPIDIIQQYQLLVDFFNQYETSPNNLNPIINKIDQQVREAWNLNQLLRARIAEVQLEKNQSENFTPENEQPENHEPQQRQESKDTRQNQKFENEKSFAENNDLIPGMKQRYQYLRQAIRAFNSSDYIEAWRLYGNAYPQIIPGRLNDLINGMRKHRYSMPALIWKIIDRNHREKIEILCMIMNMNQQPNVRTYIQSIIAQRKDFNIPELQWHIAEPNHGNAEKTSDILFFSGLYYILTGDNTNIQIIGFFLDAYNQLLRGTLVTYVGASVLRINNKRNRIIFWLKRSWSNYSEPIKNEIWSEKHNEFRDIFGPILLIANPEQVADNNQNHQQNEEEAKQHGLPPADVNDVSEYGPIATFETYAKAMLQLTEPLITCEFVKRFYPDNTDTNLKDCQNRVKNFTYQRIRNDEDRFRFYYALALIR